MKKIFSAALAGLLAIGPLHAQSPTPSPTPTGEMEIDAAAPARNDALAPALREEVNLIDLENAESMEIPAPPGAPDPDKAPMVTEPLEGEEETPARPEPTGTVEVIAADQGKIINAKVGNLIRITLESNPSTGYNWELRDFEYGTAVFSSSDLVARKTGNVLFGAPGNTVFTLQAVKPGTQKILLVYRRPWEPQDQVAASFQFQLEVAP
jgi:predicted secreted protein